MKPHILETIIVEGRYDKNTVAQVVDANIIETRGFGVFSDAALIALIRNLAETRGVIIFTDSDGAGFLIRGRLKSTLGGVGVKHAFIPDIEGRERRKRTASKAGLLGVEGMPPEVIIDALRTAGATFEDADGSNRIKSQPVTKADMYELGLSGCPDANERRSFLKKKLGLPELLSPNALLEVLNCLITRDEFFALFSAMQQ